MAGISKTVVNLKPGKMEEVTKFIDSQSGLVTGLEGNIGFAVAITGEDELTIIGIYQSSQNARDASDTVQKVFSEMADFVASPPDRSVSSGVWFSATQPETQEPFTRDISFRDTQVDVLRLEVGPGEQVSGCLTWLAPRKAYRGQSKAEPGKLYRTWRSEGSILEHVYLLRDKQVNRA